MTTEERSNIVTELDVLYGQDDPWYGFEKLQPATMQGTDRLEPVWLIYRRGVKGRDGRTKRISQHCILMFNFSPTSCTSSSLLPFGQIQNSSSSRPALFGLSRCLSRYVLPMYFLRQSHKHPHIQSACPRKT